MTDLSADLIRNWVGRMRSARSPDERIDLERDMLRFAAECDKRPEVKPEPAPEHRRRSVPVQVVHSIDRLEGRALAAKVFRGAA